MADQSDLTSNAEKDPGDWTTDDEPMTGPQRSYLQTLCQEAEEDFDDKLTKAEASKRIDELQQKTGRGLERQRGRVGDGEGTTNPGSAGAGPGDEATVSIGPQ